jgi:stringent starvation protein B
MQKPSPPADLPSRRPYLLRAMHEWMGDAGLTPHLIVDTRREGVQVPAAYIRDQKIVLNVSMQATQNLLLHNECVEFDARVAGVVHRVSVPIAAVLGIYARETGEGMVFNEADPDGTPAAAGAAPPTIANANADATDADGPPSKPRRVKLTVVK